MADLFNIDWGGVFSGAAKNIDWGRVIVGGTGQVMADRANRRAAGTVNQAADASIQAQREAAALANARLERVYRDAQPALQSGTSHFRQIVAQDPNRLTPSDTIALEDAKRTLIRSPVFRTSGRATSAGIADIDRRVRGAALERNTGRQDRAAGQLMNRGAAATAAQTGQANIDLGLGRSTGEALQTAGATAAQGDLSTTQSMVNVLGSIFANEDKDRYKSRYAASGAEV